MTTFHPLPTPFRPATFAPVLPIAARLHRPERDFGTGYGRSSGYAASRHYVPNWAPARFRCA